MGSNKNNIREPKWRVLLVDDHPVVRAGLAALIGGQEEFEICGETGSIASAQDLIRAVGPDLVVLDLSLSDGNGLDLIKRLRKLQPDVRVLVCSMHDEALFAQRALNSGALGYINKHEATVHIVDAVRSVLSGKVWLSQAMTERVLLGVTQRSVDDSVATMDRLSDRELEVFLLIGQGLGPSQIAEQLRISVKTVETHREKIKKKLNLRSGSELNRCAMQWLLETN